MSNGLNQAAIDAENRSMKRREDRLKETGFRLKKPSEVKNG